MFFRLLLIGIGFSVLNMIFPAAKNNKAARNDPQKKNIKIPFVEEQPGNKGYEWLESIFTCPTGSGYCFPDENQIFTERFQRFLRETNKLYAQAYNRTPEAQEKIKAAYTVRWEPVYTLYKEETWPFGRGNGGINKLQHVDIRSVGGRDYVVTIDFSPSYQTINRVTLIRENNHFLIDYIQTDYIDFQVEKGNRDLNFMQAWTWKYKDESIDKMEIGHQGTITAYYNPKTKNWLMNRDTYGFLGEMFIWIIARPDSTYLYSTSSPHPGEGGDLAILQADWTTSSNLPPYLDKTEELKLFRGLNSPTGILLGEKYIFTGSSMAESNELYLKRMEGMSFTPLFKLGSNFSGEPRLPYSIPEYLPSDLAILEEEVIYAGNQGKAYIQLESVKDTLITVEIP